MYTDNKDYFTEIVDLILYKYNSVDSKIWALVKRKPSHMVLSDDSVLIEAEEVKSILLTHFRKDIDRIQATGGAVVHKEATSVYFIWKMLEDIPNLRWMKMTLNRNSSYNRLVQVDEMKTIKYSLRILRGTFRIFDYFSPAQIPFVNKILHNSKILDKDQHFKVMRLQDILNRLDNYLSQHNTSEMATAISVFIQQLEDYEVDNPEVLLITDYDLDI